MSSSPYLLAEQDGDKTQPKHVGRSQTPPHCLENDSTCCAEQSTRHFFESDTGVWFGQPTIYIYIYMYVYVSFHIHMQGQHFRSYQDLGGGCNYSALVLGCC